MVPKVRSTFKKLLPDAEECKKAKDMLKERYRDTCKIVNVQKKMELPVIHGLSRPTIHDMCDQLHCPLQPLDTLGRL